MSVTLTAELNPLPCPRPRIAVRGRFPTAYYPAAYKKWKEDAARLFRIELNNRPPLAGPLRVSVACYMQRPKTTKLSHPKPDVDNFGKSVLDALTQAGLWEDDCQVIHLEVSKQWTIYGGHITVNVEKA